MSKLVVIFLQKHINNIYISHFSLGKVQNKLININILFYIYVHVNFKV